MRKSDGRIWAKFTLDFADSPKIAALSDSAFRTIVEMILYSRRLLTDGVVRSDVAERRWSSDSLTELLTNDSRNPSLKKQDGNYIIHDFLEEQDSREEVESRKRRNQANGRLGGLAKSKQGASKSLSEESSENVAETETETEISISKDIDIVHNSRDDITALCEQLKARIEANGSKCPSITKSWQNAARLLLDSDRRGFQEAQSLIDWCQRDPFWKSNILSMPKFRQKYDTLRLQSQRATNGGTTNRAEDRFRQNLAAVEQVARRDNSDRWSTHPRIGD